MLSENKNQVKSVKMEIIERVECHKDFVRRIIFFGEPYYKFVSCSDDTRILIHDSLRNERVGRIKNHVDYVWGIQKLREDIFFSNGDDGKVLFFSIIPPYKLIREFDFSNDSKSVYAAAAVKSDPCKDLFLVYISGIVSLSSFSKGEVIRTMPFEKCGNCFKRIIMSNEFPQCYYINVEKEEYRSNVVKIVNFETTKTENVFSKHGMHSVNCIEIANILSREILFVGGNDCIHIYDVIENKLIGKIEGMDGTTYAIRNFRNRCFAIGDANGNFYLIDLLLIRQKCVISEYGKKFPILLSKLIHPSKRIHDIELASISEDECTFQVATCSSDKSYVISKISGISLPQESDDERNSILETQDLKERVEFLMTFGEFGDFGKNCLLKIMLKNSEISNIFKSLLLLL